MTGPRWWAGAAVRLATAAIPPGVARDRYRAELVADLWDRTPGQQARDAVSLLLGARALRHALVEAGALPFAHSPTWCHLRLHHRWTTARTDDGAAYRRCRDCGHDDDGLSQGASPSGVAIFAVGVHPG